MKPIPTDAPELRTTRAGLAGLALIALLAWPAAAGAVHGGSDREVLQGDTVSPVSVVSRNGENLQIPAAQGVTAVLFWAVWSPRSAPALELWSEFERSYSDQPLTIITVNAEGQDFTASDIEAIDRFAAEHAHGLPVVIDEGLELFDALAVKALPTVFLLDSSGKVLLRYASFPSSAPLDLKEELEVRLGLRERESEEERASRGKLQYQPENNALLYYNLGVQLYRKGMQQRAVERMVMALQRDPAYTDPLRTLEGIYFADGRTDRALAELEALLTGNGLETLVPAIGEGEPIVLEGPPKVDAMERMRQLLEDSGPSPAGTP